MLKFHCAVCGQKLTAPDEQDGKVGKCIKCGEKVRAHQELPKPRVLQPAPPPDPEAVRAIEETLDLNATEPDGTRTESAVIVAHPVLPYRASSHETKRRSAGLLVALTVGALLVGAAAAYFLLAPAKRTVRAAVAPAAKPMPVVPAPAPPLTTLTYEQIVQKLGGEFVLTKEPMMDGTTKYLGTARQLDAVLLLTGEPQNIRYAHLAMYLTPSGRKFLADQITLKQVDSMNPRELDQVLAQYGAITIFLNNALPGWNGGPKWVRANIEKAMRADGSTPTTIANGCVISLEGDSVTGMLKVIVQAP